MSNRFISLLLAFGMGLLVMYFAHQKEVIPNRYHQLHDSIQINAQERIDSLKVEIRKIRFDRFNDSLRTAAKLKINGIGTKKIKDDIQKVSFKDYTDTELDSILFLMYPDSIRTGELYIY